MSLRLTVATAKRILQQVRRDRRTVALLLAMPLLLLFLLKAMFWNSQGLPQPGTDGITFTNEFDIFGPRLMGLFPMTLMFVVTSVTTLRERVSGTMERLMASPLRRGDLVLGYALAFGAIATVQAILLVAFGVGVLNMDFEGNVLALGLIIVLDAILGTVLGLAASSLARTEFQAVQMMPTVIIPQLLLAGLFVKRHEMPIVLDWVSDALPLSYAIDAINEIVAGGDIGDVGVQLGILAAFIVGALALATLTLRRRTG